MDVLVVVVVLLVCIWLLIKLVGFLFLAILRVFNPSPQKQHRDSLGVAETAPPGETAFDAPDSFEGWFYDAPEPRTANANLRFKYRDGNGNLTERTVRVRQYDNKLHGGIIYGHCHLRDANRTFRFDRISDCLDVDSGEVIPDLRAHLRSEYVQSREYTLDNLAEDNRDLLRVLLYMVKADGQFRAAEKSVVAKYLQDLSGDSRLDEQSTAALLSEFTIPSEQAFKIAVGKLLKSGGTDPNSLRRCCQQIVETQKTIHPMEQRALDYIEKKMPKRPIADIEL